MLKTKNIKFHSEKSIRMCIACHQRDFQKNLLRFKVTESTLQMHDGKGRSFYLCYDCLQKDKTHFYLKRYIKNAQNLKEQFEEIIQICQK